ncbi:SDR family oxidoreductase [Stackebrandtia nassauensis]|uniref:NmrA family protein n=1 Tax=Stackebrandtia nassauensis (strain DSM 44728 / CIP 108903 / NRRL B-16338 / NBRC 102104 / LLR-40K-21) TaxID=446470 RepID=D3PY48_STANL|nr:SDR family oxidoreductase [Stackebrandtia nassauensis]ADD45377.1 NmrA family protein [Stackebrandtia nassauensis DSM 44728]
MKIAVAGATGNIGKLTVAALEKQGHEVVGISRSLGVDLATGEGLDAALTGVEAVIDVTNIPIFEEEAVVKAFNATTGNLLAAGQRAGVRHHVLLSITGTQRVKGNPHYAGKREQERLVSSGPVPWTIVPAAQFHDFAEMVAGWTEQDGVATIAPALVQPIAQEDVADILAEVAVGEPQGYHVDIAGPDKQDLVDMARRSYQARGRDITLVPSWESVFGPDMAGNVMLPGDNARIAPTSFDDWLARQS